VSIGKWFVLGVWLLCVAGYVLVDGTAVSTVAAAVFWLLVVVHSIECVVFSSRMRAAGGPLAQHIGKTMLFGIFHIRELPRAGGAA
jgi:uncharacterized protein YhhL (DUF1145 family)